MGYIGPSPNPGQNREVDDISSGFNGSTTAFTLQVNSENVSPGSSNAIIVSLGGVVQNPATDYTVAASTLTFTTAPANGLSFFGLVLGQGIDTEGTADDSIGPTQLQSNAVTTAKILDDAVTFSKIQNVSATDRILGRDSSGAGVIEEITPAALRTMINVADGATASKLIQVISANKPDQFDTTSTSFVDVASLTATITPTSASNKILVTCHVFANCEDAAVLRLVRHRADTGTVAIGNGQSGSTDNQGFAMVRQDDGNLGSGYGIQILDTSYNTTVQLNYKIQARATSGSAPLGINRRIDNTDYSLSSSITAMEVS